MLWVPSLSLRIAGVGLCSAVILITMKHDPAKHKLTRGLARLIGLHTGTEAQAVEAVWRYIKVCAHPCE